MDLRLLESFVAVGEELHFGRAAERLHISQSPLSHRIRRLEQEVGCRLLARTTRRVQLTPAGRAFLERARRLLADAELAAAAARDAEQGRLGRLAVSFSGSLTYALLPLVALTYGRDFPMVDLELHGELLSPEQAPRLLAGELDVGFLRLPIPEAGLRTEIIWREPLVAVLPQHHDLAGQAEIAVADLADCPFIAYPGRRGSALYDALVRCCEQGGFAPRVVREVRETHALVCFVAAGFGVSLVPASVQHLQTTGIVYRDLADADATVAMAIAWRQDDDSPILREFLEWVRNTIRWPLDDSMSPVLTQRRPGHEPGSGAASPGGCAGPGEGSAVARVTRGPIRGPN